MSLVTILSGVELLVDLVVFLSLVTILSGVVELLVDLMIILSGVDLVDLRVVFVTI